MKIISDLLNMFNKGYPTDLDLEKFVTPTMNAWGDYWVYPAILAAGVTVLFAIGFWDKMTPENEQESEASV